MKLTEKQQFVLNLLIKHKPFYISPGFVGSELYNKFQTGSGHSSTGSPICKKLVDIGLAERNRSGHYKAIITTILLICCLYSMGQTKIGQDKKPKIPDSLFYVPANHAQGFSFVRDHQPQIDTMPVFINPKHTFQMFDPDGNIPRILMMVYPYHPDNVPTKGDFTNGALIYVHKSQTEWLNDSTMLVKPIKKP